MSKRKKEIVSATTKRPQIRSRSISVLPKVKLTPSGSEESIKTLKRSESDISGLLGVTNKEPGSTTERESLKAISMKQSSEGLKREVSRKDNSGTRTRSSLTAPAKNFFGNKQERSIHGIKTDVHYPEKVRRNAPSMKDRQLQQQVDQYSQKAKEQHRAKLSQDSCSNTGDEHSTKHCHRVLEQHEKTLAKTNLGVLKSDSLSKDHSAKVNAIDTAFQRKHSAASALESLTTSSSSDYTKRYRKRVKRKMSTPLAMPRTSPFTKTLRARTSFDMRGSRQRVRMRSISFSGHEIEELSEQNRQENDESLHYDPPSPKNKKKSSSKKWNQPSSASTSLTTDTVFLSAMESQGTVDSYLSITSDGTSSLTEKRLSPPHGIKTDVHYPEKVYPNVSRQLQQVEHREMRVSFDRKLGALNQHEAKIVKAGSPKQQDTLKECLGHEQLETEDSSPKQQGSLRECLSPELREQHKTKDSSPQQQKSFNKHLDKEAREQHQTTLLKSTSGSSPNVEGQYNSNSGDKPISYVSQEKGKFHVSVSPSAKNKRQISILNDRPHDHYSQQPKEHSYNTSASVNAIDTESHRKHSIASAMESLTTSSNSDNTKRYRKGVKRKLSAPLVMPRTSPSTKTFRARTLVDMRGSRQRVRMRSTSFSGYELDELSDQSEQEGDESLYYDPPSLKNKERSGSKKWRRSSSASTTLTTDTVFLSAVESQETVDSYHLGHEQHKAQIAKNSSPKQQNSLEEHLSHEQLETQIAEDSSPKQQDSLGHEQHKAQIAEDSSPKQQDSLRERLGHEQLETQIADDSSSKQQDSLRERLGHEPREQHETKDSSPNQQNSLNKHLDQDSREQHKTKSTTLVESTSHSSPDIEEQYNSNSGDKPISYVSQETGELRESVSPSAKQFSIFDDQPRNHCSQKVKDNSLNSKLTSAAVNAIDTESHRKHSIASAMESLTTSSSSDYAKRYRIKVKRKLSAPLVMPRTSPSTKTPKTRTSVDMEGNRRKVRMSASFLGRIKRELEELSDQSESEGDESIHWDHPSLKNKKRSGSKHWKGSSSPNLSITTDTTSHGVLSAVHSHRTVGSNLSNSVDKNLLRTLPEKVSSPQIMSPPTEQSKPTILAYSIKENKQGRTRSSGVVKKGGKKAIRLNDYSLKHYSTSDTGAKHLAYLDQSSQGTGKQQDKKLRPALKRKHESGEKKGKRSHGETAPNVNTADNEASSNDNDTSLKTPSKGKESALKVIPLTSPSTGPPETGLLSDSIKEKGQRRFGDGLYRSYSVSSPVADSQKRFSAVDLLRTIEGSLSNSGEDSFRITLSKRRLSSPQVTSPSTNEKMHKQKLLLSLQKGQEGYQWSRFSSVSTPDAISRKEFSQTDSQKRGESSSSKSSNDSFRARVLADKAKSSMSPSRISNTSKEDSDKVHDIKQDRIFRKADGRLTSLSQESELLPSLKSQGPKKWKSFDLSTPATFSRKGASPAALKKFVDCNSSNAGDSSLRTLSKRKLCSPQMVCSTPLSRTSPRARILAGLRESSPYPSRSSSMAIPCALLSMLMFLLLATILIRQLS